MLILFMFIISVLGTLVLAEYLCSVFSYKENYGNLLTLSFFLPIFGFPNDITNPSLRNLLLFLLAFTLQTALYGVKGGILEHLLAYGIIILVLYYFLGISLLCLVLVFESYKGKRITFDRKIL